MNIPINARVECLDGTGGRSTRVIVNPLTRTILYLVVQDNSFPSPVERLVPVEQISDTTSKEIHLTCTISELSQMEAYSEVHYIDSDPSDYEDISPSVSILPYSTPTDALYARVEEKRISPGDLAVRRGMPVEGCDGYIGRINELVIDPASGQISHILVMKGHLWGKREIALPLSTIDRVEDATIYLNIDKQAIEGLAALSLERAWKDIHANEIELMVWTFTDIDAAPAMMKNLKKLTQEYQFDILNAAVLIKDRSGKTSIKETDDISAGHGALFGAITGGIIGLLGGPAGVVIGAAAGAATGGVAAKKIDMGFSDEKLRLLQKELHPGSSALVLLAEHRWIGKVLEALSGSGGKLQQQRLSEATVHEFLKKVDADNKG